MNPNWSLILASGALLGSATAYWNTAATRTRWLGERELQSRLVEIERGIASTRQLLQQNLALVAESNAVTELVDPGLGQAGGTRVAVADPRPLDQGRLDALAGRLDELEILLAATSHRQDGATARPETIDEVLGSELAHQSMLEYQHLFTDPTVEWARRIDALRMLRRFPAEQEALNVRVVDSAIEAFRNEKNPVRLAQVIDAIDGVRDPRLAGELLRLAQASSDERLRAEAVGALEGFLDDALVRDYLALVRESDPSSKIRRLAERAID